ncbi:MAG: putative Ig domain-containing protein, partial [Gammaproteobacteria bacterium]
MQPKKNVILIALLSLLAIILLFLYRAEPLQITTPSPLPEGKVGENYDTKFTGFDAKGGKKPYRWSGGPSAETGLSLNLNGTLTGAPTKGGDLKFDVTVTDYANKSATKPFDLPIGADGGGVGDGGPKITTSSLLDGTKGVFYSATLMAQGGTPPLKWTGTVGADLILSGTGMITGVPTSAGTFSFNATVTDGAGRSDTKTFALKINVGVVTPPPPPP